MKKEILKLPLLFLPLSIFFLEPTDFNTKIISENFTGKKINNLEIVYTKQNDSIEIQIGKITIKAFNDKFLFHHLSFEKNDSIKSFWGNNIDLTNIIYDFENQSYKNNSKWIDVNCGTGVAITMKIDNLKTEFSYCEDRYDGLNVLISNLVEHKKKG